MPLLADVATCCGRQPLAIAVGLESYWEFDSLSTFSQLLYEKTARLKLFMVFVSGDLVFTYPQHMLVSGFPSPALAFMKTRAHFHENTCCFQCCITFEFGVLPLVDVAECCWLMLLAGGWCFVD